MRPRLNLSSVFSVLVASSVLACAGDTADQPSTDGSPTTGGTVIVSTAGEPDVVFPALAHTQQGRHVADQVFERLAEIGDSLRTGGDKGFEPRLAERWSWAADSTSIAFHLNPRARWHDGRPVRAHDVRFSYQLTMDPKIGSPNADLMRNIDSVQVRDSLTAVVWYKTRTPEQFYDFVYQTPIVPEHVYGSVPREGLRTAELIRKPIGSGRFRFVRWEPGQRLEIVADTAHYRGRARLDRVVYVFAQDFDASLTRLMAGEADFMENILPDHIPRIEGDSNLRVVDYPGMQTSFVVFNVRDARRGAPHPVFGDRAVRLALSHAANRDEMARNVFGRLGKVAVGPLPRAHPVSDSSIRVPGFDLARAGQLLDSAGWRMGADSVRSKNGRPLALSILVPSSSKARMSYAVLLQNAFKTIGARATIDQVDYPTFTQRLNSGNFDVALHAIGVDPSGSTLKQYWHSSSVGKGGANVGAYANPAFDVVLDSAMSSRDPDQLRSLAVRASRILVDDAPAIWLYDVLMMGAGHRRIRTEGLRADTWWSGLADWWIPESERLPRDRIGVGGVVAAR
jgi:peptide/nickel transport system substrate-binding protein